MEMTLREQFRESLNLDNKSKIEELFLDNSQDYIIWLEKKIEHIRNHSIDEANSELVRLNAMKELIKDNTLGCEIYIDGLTVGLCNNLSVLPALENNISEINKFLKGEPNDWE